MQTLKGGMASDWYCEAGFSPSVADAIAADAVSDRSEMLIAAQGSA